MKWPRQSECDAFYGNPRGRNGSFSKSWAKANLVTVSPPFAMVTAWDPKGPVRSIQIHRKCADSLRAILEDIWQSSGKSQKKIAEWGANLFGGSFNFRLMRGSSSLSMHSWGCAIDLDPARNGLGDYTPVLTPDHPVAQAFRRQGWTHGADWNGNKKVQDERRPDAMHFQAATV